MLNHQAPTGLRGEVRLIGKRLRQVWRLVSRQHKLSLAAAALVMALTSVSNIAVAILLGKLVNAVLEGSRSGVDRSVVYGAAAWMLGLVAGAYLFREVFNVVRRVLVQNTVTRINKDMSLRLVAHLMKVDLAALGQDKVGALHGRIFRSVDGFVRFLRLGFLDFLPALFTGFLALLTAVTRQPLLGVVMVGVIPVAVFLTVRQLISQKGVRLKLMRDCEDIDGAVVEQLSGMEYVRAANTHRQEVRRLARAAEKRRSREVRHHFQMALFGSAKALNEGFFHVLVLALAVYLAMNGQIEAGEVLTFSMLFTSVMSPLAEIHRVLDEGHEASLRVGDLLAMLAEPVDRSFQVPEPHEPWLQRGEPAIEVEDLVVEYRTPQDEHLRALDGVSLTIRHGETIGVAGRSGCGKSTWLRVLLRLIHAQAGVVRVGGVPIEQVSREAVGRLLGYVGQTPFVFAGSIAENIAYGNGRVTPEELQRVAELANLHDEIMLMPGGYDAAVTERGANLSGGQRQRLAIARILLKQPPILILDEATSALDNISERRVQQSLGITDVNRTTILVAHRLSTLRDADRIFVFDEGRVVEVGTYDELVQRGGVFTELVMSAETGLTSPGPGEAQPAEAAAV